MIPTTCPPIIFTNFSWAKSHDFFIIKLHRNIQHLFKLATSIEYKRDLFSTNVEYLCEFWFFHYSTILHTTVSMFDFKEDFFLFSKTSLNRKTTVLTTFELHNQLCHMVETQHKKKSILYMNVPNADLRL